MAGPTQSKASTQTDQSTKITETTTVSINDVGLTGNAAVGVVEALSFGAVAQAKAITDLITPLIETQERIFGTPKGQERIEQISAENEAAESDDGTFELVLAAAAAAALIWGLGK